MLGPRGGATSSLGHWGGALASPAPTLYLNFSLQYGDPGLVGARLPGALYRTTRTPCLHQGRAGGQGRDGGRRSGRCRRNPGSGG